MFDSNEIQILPFSSASWQDIARIYKDGIATGMATFETKIPAWEQWDNAHCIPCRFKAVIKDELVGWAALAPTSKREVYRGVAEVSVYIDPLLKGKGIGYLLLTHLINQSELAGFWTLQASIFSENVASIKLHKKAGFRIIGIREKVGKLGNIWKDNLIMERRSTIIGNATH